MCTVELQRVLREFSVLWKELNGMYVCSFPLYVYSNCVIIRIQTINDQNGLLKTAKVEVLFLLYMLD